MTSSPHLPDEASACPNCGHGFPPGQALPRHCPDCGQETHLHAPSLWEFVHEFITHYIALEGALWRSLRQLLTRPGQLTLDYLAGRRRQHVLPLRLYLTASFLFFVTLKLTGLPMSTHVELSDQPPVAASAPAARPGATPASAASSPIAPSAMPGPASACGASSAADCGPVARWAGQLEERLEARLDGDKQAERNAAMVSRMLAWAPYAVFLMLPVFAGLTRLVYWRRPLAYGAHVVFSLHLHTLWCLAAWLNLILPGSLGGVALLSMPVYGLLSLHRVFGGGWPGTLLRALLITLAYGGLLVLATLVMTLASALST